MSEDQSSGISKDFFSNLAKIGSDIVSKRPSQEQIDEGVAKAQQAAKDQRAAYYSQEGQALPQNVVGYEDSDVFQYDPDTNLYLTDANGLARIKGFDYDDKGNLLAMNADTPSSMGETRALAAYAPELYSRGYDASQGWNDFQFHGNEFRDIVDPWLSGNLNPDDWRSEYAKDIVNQLAWIGESGKYNNDLGEFDPEAYWAYVMGLNPLDWRNWSDFDRGSIVGQNEDARDIEYLTNRLVGEGLRNWTDVSLADILGSYSPEKTAALLNLIDQRVGDTEGTSGDEYAAALRNLADTQDDADIKEALSILGSFENISEAAKGDQLLSYSYNGKTPEEQFADILRMSVLDQDDAFLDTVGADRLRHDFGYYTPMGSSGNPMTGSWQMGGGYDRRQGTDYNEADYPQLRYINPQVADLISLQKQAASESPDLLYNSMIRDSPYVYYGQMPMMMSPYYSARR